MKCEKWARERPQTVHAPLQSPASPDPSASQSEDISSTQPTITRARYLNTPIYGKMQKYSHREEFMTFEGETMIKYCHSELKGPSTVSDLSDSDVACLQPEQQYVMQSKKS